MSALRGLTLVIVTHDSTVARRAPRTALIKKGRLTIRETQRTGTRT
jgi:putative ABC transport system ATP-binding protein